MPPEDPGPHDPLPALIAELDQALVMAPQLARVARSYFDAFKAEAFTDAQALWLTIAQFKDDNSQPPA